MGHELLSDRVNKNRRQEIVSRLQYLKKELAEVEIVYLEFNRRRNSILCEIDGLEDEQFQLSQGQLSFDNEHVPEL